VLQVTFFYLINRKLAISVLVKRLEHPRQVVFLLLSEQLAHNKGIGSLLEGLRSMETLNVVKNIHCN
jgi:hypothetical protein